MHESFLYYIWQFQYFNKEDLKTTTGEKIQIFKPGILNTDSGPDLPTYGTYARFLESADEYFDYSPDGIPGQGRWMIYGLHLPRNILDKIYHDNAARLFGLTTTMADQR